MSNLQTSAAKPDSRFWKKKTLVSFLLSVLIFFIHISSFYNYSDTGNLMSSINTLLAHTIKEGFTRFAVPLYFIMSGALFFRDYTSDRYIGKLKNRVRTLLIPYLMWNVIWMIFRIVTSYTFISNYFIGREKFELTLGNVLLAIFHHGANGHFWFVFDLMVFALASPLVDLLTRTRRTAIISIAAAQVLNLMGFGIPASIFYTGTSIVYYLIGAAIGKYYLSHFVHPSTKKVRILSLIVLLGYGVHNMFFFNHVVGTPADALQFIQHLLCAWAFWNVCDWIPDSSIAHRFSDCAFAVYAMHGNVGACIVKLLYLLLPKSEYFAVVNFVLSVTLTLLFIKCFCMVTRKYMPKLYEMLMGSR